MVPVSRLSTAPHSHFICCPPYPPLCLTLLFSNKTLSRLTLYPPSSLQTTPLLGSPGIHNQLTRSRINRETTICFSFLPHHWLSILQFCSRLYSFGIGEIKVSKTKTNIKIKLSKRAPSCFPEVQIVLQVSQRDHHHITIHHSLTPNTKTNTKHKDKHKWLIWNLYEKSELYLLFAFPISLLESL